MTDNLLVERRDRVAVVTLNRPDVRNAFDEALIGSLARVMRELDGDAGVRVVVLAGAGSAFCAGADLNWMKRMAGYSYEQNRSDAEALADMLRAIDGMRKPTIARVHGPAFAGGVGLVAVCDIAVGAAEAKFCLSEAKLGLSPATISPYVLRAMGARQARRYFLTAEVFDAAEAHRLGLLTMLAPAAQLDAAVDALAGQLCAAGPDAIARIKHLIHDVAGRTIDGALVKETAKRIAEIRVSPEGREGIASFLEKRKPSWTQGA